MEHSSLPFLQWEPREDYHAAGSVSLSDHLSLGLADSDGSRSSRWKLLGEAAAVSPGARLCGLEQHIRKERDM